MSPLAPWLLAIGIAISATDAMAYSCAVSATALNFGVVEGRANQQWRSTATLTVTCQSGNSAAAVSYQLLSADSGTTERTLQGVSGQAPFELYTSSSYRQPWGDTASSAISDSYSLAAHSSATRQYTIYARLRPGRQAATGPYSTVLLVRLVY